MANWRLLYPQRVSGPDDAVAFVAAVGFCTWLPLAGMDFPNLAEMLGEGPATAETGGDERPEALRQPVDSHAVMNETWFWKDDLHVARRVYYALLIRAQPSFLAPDFLPDFIAALPAEERAPDRLYLEGRLSRDAMLVYEYLRDHPAQPTRALRRGARLGTRNVAAATVKALLELQRRFVVCKVDVTGRTRGTYSYVWDLAERFWPEAFDEARATRPDLARDRIRERLAAFGIAPTPLLENRLFGWR